MCRTARPGISGPALACRVAPCPMRLQTPNSLATAFRRPLARFLIPGAGTAQRRQPAALPGRERARARTGQPPVTGRDLPRQPALARTPGREVPGLRARMAGPEHPRPRPLAQAVRPPALLGPARVVTRSHPGVPAPPAPAAGQKPPGQPATMRPAGRSRRGARAPVGPASPDHLGPPWAAGAIARSRPRFPAPAQRAGLDHPGPREAARAATRSRLELPGSVRTTGAVPHELPGSARTTGAVPHEQL